MVGFIKNSMNKKLQKANLINKNLSFETISYLKKHKLHCRKITVKITNVLFSNSRKRVIQ